MQRGLIIIAILSTAIEVDLEGIDVDRPRGPARYAAGILAGLRQESPESLTAASPGGFRVHLGPRPRLRPGRKLAAAVYDLGHLGAWRAYGPSEWLAANWRAAWTVRQCRLLIAPSALAAAQLVRALRVPPDRVVHVPPALPPGFARSPRERVEALRERLGLPSRYFVWVGTPSRRKNLATLLRAWADARAALDPDVGLVLAGPGMGDEPVRREMALSRGTRAIGYLPDGDLPALLSGAIALVSPSHYESCGTGALEALACATPVVASAGTAVAEVAGDAGMCIAATDRGSWASAIALLANKPEIRPALAGNAARIIARHQPAVSARALLDAVERAAHP